MQLPETVRGRRLGAAVVREAHRSDPLRPGGVRRARKAREIASAGNKADLR